MELLSKIASGGVLTLRKAIAQHLRDFHGMKVDPMQIVIGAGTEYLLGLIIELLGFNLVYASEDQVTDAPMPSIKTLMCLA